MKNPIHSLGAALAGFLAFSPSAIAVNFGPTPYLQFPGSPFAGLSFSSFSLETFEDGLLNTPGVSISIGPGNVLGPGPGTDSVDADDGSINGSGDNGHSLAGVQGITFAFSGLLPTHAGIVWTDGGGLITFEAFDNLGVSLGVISGNHADGNFAGGTAEDHFYGASNLGGISSFRISNPSAGIEVDHLQFGIVSTVPTSNSVPDGISTVAGFSCCFVGLLALRRRNAEIGERG